VSHDEAVGRTHQRFAESHEAARPSHWLRLEADIRDAYVFFMNNFEEGDRIYLFGFSRGAYYGSRARRLSTLYGRHSPRNEPLVPYAIRMLLAIQKRSRRMFSARAGFLPDIRSRPCPIHSLGMDTVSSVGG